MLCVNVAEFVEKVVVAVFFAVVFAAALVGVVSVGGVKGNPQADKGDV